jgi:very-short-patch-repair endonuclease
MSRSFGDPSRKESPDQLCARLAGKQHGVLSHAQVRASGISKQMVLRRIEAGRWRCLLPGVYRLEGSPVSWHQDLMAACLWSGNGAVASHRAAASLWRLDGFSPGPIELSSESHTRQMRSGLVVHRVNVLSSADVTTISAIPVTNPTRTVVDLGSVVEIELLEQALDDALRKGLTSLPRLRWTVERLQSRGRRGIGPLRQLLSQRRAGEIAPASALEARLIKLLSNSGLPKPKRQYEIRDRGKLIARVDLAYPELRLAIEADGYRYHSGRAAWQRDLVRRNALTNQGWRLLHVTWEDLRSRPAEVVDEIAAAVSLKTARIDRA